MAQAHTLAELHTHTNQSDGALSPTELAHQLASHDIKIWSLTDHDTCRGCHEAASAASSLGITFIPGVEVSARFKRSVHILGYGLRWDDPELQAIFDQRLELRATRMSRMVEKARAQGFDVTMEEVSAFSAQGNLARPHLARAFIQRGWATSVEDAFEKYLDEDGPIYVPSPWPSPQEAIELIHQYGGIAILAHPGKYDLDDEIPGWIDAGLDGIEVRHPIHTEAMTKTYTELAKEHRLLMTASSDFHGGEVAKDRLLGQTEVPDSWLDALFESLGVHHV